MREKIIFLYLFCYSNILLFLPELVLDLEMVCSLLIMISAMFLCCRASEQAKLRAHKKIRMKKKLKSKWHAITRKVNFAVFFCCKMFAFFSNG